MPLSVERLKELLAYETEWLAMFDHAAAVRGMADLEARSAALHRDAEKAYLELLAIKEAEPVMWMGPYHQTITAQHKNDADDLYQDFSVPLIRKPE